MLTIGDLVLIYQEGNPATFARIEDIWADKKPDWYQVKLLMLQVPVVELLWILREAYLGGEQFTMNGVKVRLEKVEAPSAGRKRDAPVTPGASSTEAKGTQGKVISLFDRKKG